MGLGDRKERRTAQPRGIHSSFVLFLIVAKYVTVYISFILE